jgi:hypothetical protein
VENSEKDLRAEVTTNYLRLTDAAIRAATLPPGKSQHYLHDSEQLGLAIRIRSTGGRTWVFLFTKPGARGTQRKTLGAWPKFNEKAARKAATVAAGEVVIGVDPNDAKREAKRQQMAEKQCTTLATSNGASAKVTSSTTCSPAIARPRKPVRRGSGVERRAARWPMRRSSKSGMHQASSGLLGY